MLKTVIFIVHEISNNLGFQSALLIANSLRDIYALLSNVAIYLTK